MIQSNYQADFFRQVISTCIDPKTLQYKESTREGLLELLKKYGYNVENKLPDQIKKDLDDMITYDISRTLDSAQKKVLGEISLLLLGTEDLQVIEKPLEKSLCLTSDYISRLIQENKDLLNEKSLEQLYSIKRILDYNNNCIIAKDTISIDNGYVMIGKYRLPTDHVFQNRGYMIRNTKDVTYPDYAEFLLNFAAGLKGKKFSPDKLWWNELQNNKIDENDFCKIMNTEVNKEFIRTLVAIIGFNGEIPIGKTGFRRMIFLNVLSWNPGFIVSIAPDDTSHHNLFVPYTN